MRLIGDRRRCHYHMNLQWGYVFAGHLTCKRAIKCRGTGYAMYVMYAIQVRNAIIYRKKRRYIELDVKEMYEKCTEDHAPPKEYEFGRSEK